MSKAPKQPLNPADIIGKLEWTRQSYSDGVHACEIRLLLRQGGYLIPHTLGGREQITVDIGSRRFSGFVRTGGQQSGRLKAVYLCRILKEANTEHRLATVMEREGIAEGTPIRFDVVGDRAFKLVALHK